MALVSMTLQNLYRSILVNLRFLVSTLDRNLKKFLNLGSDKIMIGAGSSIDPFWHIYQQHNTPEILKLLESFRIGNLLAEDNIGTADLADPWSNEPKRHPILKPASLKPFNAEPPASLLVEDFITPV